MLAEIASAATAMGLAIAVWQLEQQRRMARATFEENLVWRYWDVLDRLSIGARMGRAEEMMDEDRCVAHAYFRLSDEQVYLARKRKKVRRKTWEAWAPGIRQKLAREPFVSEWKHVLSEPHLRLEYADLIDFMEEA